ncbi:hypothetical protein RB595_003166 [Gaeumannomyces hyphopodioides]
MSHAVGGGGYAAAGTTTHTARLASAMATRIGSEDAHDDASEERTPHNWAPPAFAPDPDDTEYAHRFYGQVQPSAGERLTHIYNFLADEDPYTCPDWEAKVVDAMDYVHFLETSPMMRSFKKPTLDLLDEVRGSLQSHLDFIKHTSRKPEMPRMPRPDGVKKPALSLPPNPNNNLGLIRGAGGVPRARKVLHRPPTVVNNLVSYFRGSDLHIKKLAASEDAMWSSRPASEGALAGEEQARYQLGLLNPAMNRAWPSDITDSAESYATVRGLRRAGLQMCLSQLDSSENSTVQTVWSRVVPPAKASDLLIMQRSASRIQFTPIAIPREKAKGRDVGGSPYTRRMHHYWRVFDTWWDEARKSTEESHGSSSVLAEEGTLARARQGLWVALPRPRVAYVNHGLPSAAEHAHQMLKVCKAVSALMNRTFMVAPRQLIMRCVELRDLGEEGGEPAAEVLRWRNVDRLENGRLRLLNETELGFLRLLTQPSVNRGMIRQLGVQAPLYLVFADRLQRILDDLSPEGLFPTDETEVSVDGLLSEMHKGTMGVNQKIHFSVHDACCWLDRLSEEGRIHFRRDLEEYGYVSRPFTDLHPEMLVVLPPVSRQSEGAGAGEVNEFDAVGAPRPSELKTWNDLAAEATPEPDPAVYNFFGALSYRLGYTCAVLEKRVANAKTLGPANMSKALAEWEDTVDNWREVTGYPPTLASVCAKIGDGKPGAPKLDDAAALKRVRAKVLEEAERNANTLYPTRWLQATAADGSDVSVPIREPLWDWGQPEIRGRARRYFSLDRYPLELQTPERQAELRSGLEVDEELLWDPCAADPTKPEWLMRKATRFGQSKEVYKRGPAIFYGDTVLQKEAIVSHINTTLATGVPKPAPQRKGLFSRLSELVPFPSISSRPPTPTGPHETIRLSPVDPSLIPDSSGGMDVDP